ncbi:Hypothetical Protein FCC1311_057832 [Hondaea fermentalgiana]|uniref:Uncharacterized protein n=1 Tax=Hondaea fermentalgiana TaxID=2315210 RepID=A0A2R5GF52_9STRA|nr:Hypothetical Protein FCC1311_057832 [Hondaea fermentalgiana]|eukprot:GBG29562.1 Hypothetical Protein FCC1311_057832 [Hondaea fermentalgiana]
MEQNPVTYEPLKNAPEDGGEEFRASEIRGASSCGRRVLRVLIIACVVFVVSAALETAFDGAVSGCMKQLRGGNDGMKTVKPTFVYDNGPARDKREDCKVYYDGCNTCARASRDAPFACTERLCERPGKAYCKIGFAGSNAASVTHMAKPGFISSKPGVFKIGSAAKEDMDAPRNCKTWFTGCNTCHRALPGAQLACTRMMCHGSASPSSCRETFDETEMAKLDASDEDIVAVDIDDSARDDEFDTPEIVKPAPGMMIRPKPLVSQPMRAVKKTSVSAPDDCRQWFDGCNTCTRNEVGAELVCTRMACFQPSEPSCKAYFSD